MFRLRLSDFNVSCYGMAKIERALPDGEWEPVKTEVLQPGDCFRRDDIPGKFFTVIERTVGPVMNYEVEVEEHHAEGF